MIRFLFLIFLVVGRLIGSAEYEAKTNQNFWPRVGPLQERFFFPEASKASVEMQLRGLDETPLYILQCHPRNYKPDDDFDYSGDFECRLQTVPSVSKYSTLLTDNPFQDRDWQSRARFFAGEVIGNCADYPEYGRVRTFRLRGMRITLTLSDVVLPEGDHVHALQSFRFEVKVEDDPAALSVIAEPVPFAEPPLVASRSPLSVIRDCTKVEPKHMPGTFTRESLTRMGLMPPYAQIKRAEKTAVLPDGSYTFQFANKPLPKESQAFYLPVLDVGGKAAYEFMCSIYTAPLGNHTVITRWGMSCGLFVVGKDKNLLDEAVDPYTRVSRSHVFPWQLFGKCGAYPDWGLSREFRLRGLKLTMNFKDPIFAEGNQPPSLYGGGIERVEIRVRVEPDPTAKAPLASPSRYLDWQRSTAHNACGDIIRNGSYGPGNFTPW